MAKYTYFKDEFDKLAVEGAIGDPNGELAYAYIRVSSDDQGEEGRSGLPRQIEHIHQKAGEAGYKIPWEMVFADDFTGFSLERPALNILRREYHGLARRANAVIIEHLDRLSRNADWHQGFLLDEIRQAGIQAVFWKSFSSRIERVVVGAASQDAMETAKERMRDGVRKKAESGRITARHPAYGYKFVDKHGVDGASAAKDTHYALKDDQIPVVRLIYRRVASGVSLHKLAADLNDAGIPTPMYAPKWTTEAVRRVIRSPLYKGEFVANRWIVEKAVTPDKHGVPRMREVRRTERPESEWIRVPVPVIVDAELWQAANDILAKNKQMASRNGKRQYLLTGLLKCATCGRSYNGKAFSQRSGKEFKTPCVEYSCSSLRNKATSHLCDQGCILARTLESAVWSCVCNSLLEPDTLIEAMESEMFDQANAAVERQITYLEAEIVGRQTEDDKLYRAYVAGVFDEIEYADRRKHLKAETAKLNAELSGLLPRRASRETFEEQRAIVLKTAERLRAMNVYVDPPFELKQQILKMLVDRVTLNVREQWFRLEGTIRGQFSIVNPPRRRSCRAG